MLTDLLELSGLRDEGTTIVQKVRNYMSSDTAALQLYKTSETTCPVIQHPMHFSTLCREHKKGDTQIRKVLRKTSEKRTWKESSKEKKNTT
jgi:hypothetical protein